MSTSYLASALVASALFATAASAGAATDSELAEIREQLRTLKDQYETRLRALENRLQAAEATAPAASTGVASSTPGASASAGIAAFNPAISLVLQGTYANFSQDPTRYTLAGFAKTPDLSPGRRGLGLGESELALSANVDDRFAGNLIVSLTPENTVSVEEAYGFMPSLPYGLVPKFGRFFSAIGYQNEQHQHGWDFVDAPLVYQAFLGGQFTHDGLQLKWVAPTDQFLEFGAEVGNGDNFPGSARNRNGVGAGSVFVHTGGDIGTDHSWRAGLSYLQTRADARAGTQLDTMGNLADVAFTGKSRTAIADFVWKYAPNGNTGERNFKVQGEYFWHRERGDLTYDASGALGLMQAGGYAANRNGWYLQGAWQFMPYWRAGARYDQLNPGRREFGTNTDLLDIGAFHPDRYTVMFDYTPSEFTRFRLQYARSMTRPDVTDHQLFLQYILTLGAHGAHKF
ncbi:MAG: TonB-dependent receptor [Betaproteobacteria bacterium]